MIPRQIKSHFISNKAGYTLAEALIVSSILILVIASTIGVVIMSRLICDTGIKEISLQRDANMALERMVRGVKEPSDTFGLRNAKSFTVPAATPAGSEIDFVSSDGTTRKFLLSGSSIAYQSPTISPNSKNIYTAPENCTIMLRCWKVTAYPDNETAGIYVALSQTVGGRLLTGSVSTYVNVRNMDK